MKPSRRRKREVLSRPVDRAVNDVSPENDACSADEASAADAASSAASSANDVSSENGSASAELTVSVVFPCLEAGKFAEEAIESVLAQSPGTWELIIVGANQNGACSSLAASYARRFPDRVIALDITDPDRERPSGMAVLRNAGVGRARGKYIAFLDANDAWQPGRLAEQVAAIKSHNASLTFGLSQYWYSWSGNIDDLDRDFIPEPAVAVDALYDPAALLTALRPLGSARGPSIGHLLITRELWERIGGFDEELDSRGGDSRFLAKALVAGSVFVSGQCWNRQRILPEVLESWANISERQRVERAHFLEWLTGVLDRENIADSGIRSALARAWASQAQKEDVYYRNWNFRVAGTNEAEINGCPDRSGAIRVTVAKCTSESGWDIQLNLRRYILARGQTYRVRFEACAAGERTLNVGVSMSRDPWKGLGIYRTVELTTAWQPHDLDFIAAEDYDDARLHFDAGGSDIALELAEAGLFLRDGSPAPCGVQFGSLRRVSPINRNWGIDRGIPIDRQYIGQFLNGKAADIRGRVLEIGDDVYTCRFGGDRVTWSDVLHVVAGNPKATFVGDLSNCPQIPDGIFDCIILTQTLQFIYDLRATVQTLHRILAPGGVLLATVPGISATNDKDWGKVWYWRFSPVSARKVFAEAFPNSDVEVQCFGNALTATSFLHGLSAGELTTGELDYSEDGYEVAIGIRAVKRRKAERTTSERTPAIPARMAGREGKGKAAILMYHRIAEVDADPFSLCVAPSNFAAHLRAIQRHATTLTLAELADCVRGGKIPDRSVVITFDDGYVDNLLNSEPLLKDRGIPATVFVTTGNTGHDREFWWDELQRILLTPGSLPETLELNIHGTPYRWELGESAQLSEEVYRLSRRWRVGDEPPAGRYSFYVALWRLLQGAPESDRVLAMEQLAEWSGSKEQREAYRAMQPDEVAALAAGGLVEIGAHTVTHPSLRDLPSESQRLEMAAGKDRLEQILGSPVTSFAYPFGALSAETAAIARAAGFERACTTAQRTVQADADCLQLPRFRVDDWGELEFSERLNGWFA